MFDQQSSLVSYDKLDETVRVFPGDINLLVQDSVMNMSSLI